MKVFLDAVYESLVDKSPQHIVMALFLALAGGLIVAQLYHFLSRKAADPQVVLTGLVIFFLALAAVLGIGFERYTRDLTFSKNAVVPLANARRHPHSNIDFQIVRRILEIADTDKDGRLSPEEASEAAGLQVREAVRPNSESVDFRTLMHLVHYSLMPNPRAPGTEAPPITGQRDVEAGDQARN